MLVEKLCAHTDAELEYELMMVLIILLQCERLKKTNTRGTGVEREKGENPALRLLLQVEEK